MPEQHKEVRKNQCLNLTNLLFRVVSAVILVNLIILLFVHVHVSATLNEKAMLYHVRYVVYMERRRDTFHNEDEEEPKTKWNVLKRKWPLWPLACKEHLCKPESKLASWLAKVWNVNPSLKFWGDFTQLLNNRGNTGLDLKYTLMSFSTARPADWSKTQSAT